MAMDHSISRQPSAIDRHQPSTLSHREVTYPFLKEPALWFLAGKRQCALERHPRVGDSSQPPAQLGTRRMREAVVAQIAAIEDRVDERQSGRRTVAHRDGDGAIQLDHRRRVRSQQHLIEAGDLRPVGLGGAGRLGVERRDRRLDRIRTRPCRERSPHQTHAFGDLIAVPQRAILIFQQDQIAVPCRARRTARIVEQHQREQANRLRLRQQIDEQAPEPDRLARQVVPRHDRPRRGGIALVEHQIDHAQHGVEPRRQFVPRRHLVRNPRIANLRLGADDALRQRRCRREERLRDLLGPQAADLAQRQRHLRIRGERRMTAGEDQPQPIVLDGLIVGPRIGRDGDLRGGAGFIEWVEARLPAKAVNRLEPSRRHEPRSRILRHPFARPLFERGPERIVQRLLGRIEIAEQTDQRRQHTPRLRDVDGVDGLVNGIGRGHRGRSSRKGRKAAIRPTRRPQRQLARSSSSHSRTARPGIDTPPESHIISGGMSDTFAPEQKRINTPAQVLFASLIGTTIEFFDFYIYANAAVLVFPRLFFPASEPASATLASLATFAIASLARPIGSALFGHFGDRVGRKTTLVAALLTMGLSTVTIGLLPTYATLGIAAPLLLALCRFGQGLGLGGEWGGAVLLAIENAPPGKRAWYGMFPQLGAPVGFICSAGIFLLLSATLTDAQFFAFGWRIPFLASAALVMLGLYVRLRLPEPPVFREDVQRRERVALPMVTVLRDHPGALGRGILMSLSTFVLFYLMTVFALNWGTTALGYSRQQFLIIQLFGILFFAATIPLSAVVADRRGRRGTLMWTSVLIGAFGFALAPWLQGGTGGALLAMAAGMALMGFSYGPLCTALSELFPTAVRYTGNSLTLNLASIFGASLGPYVAPWLAGHYGRQYVGYYLTLSAVLTIAGLLSARETKDDDLTAATRR